MGAGGGAEEDLGLVFMRLCKWDLLPARQLALALIGLG